MMKFLLLVTIVLVVSAEARCPAINNLYHEIGCSPTKQDDKGCAVSFDCSNLEKRPSDRCFFAGKSFEHKEMLTKEQKLEACQSCTCDTTLEPATFQCADLECPLEWEMPAEDCILQYKSDSCCANKMLCGKKEIKDLPKCHVNHLVYHAGQRMFPDDEPCYRCICGEGFDNSTVAHNEHCRKISCGTSLRDSAKVRHGCVPVYLGDQTCCPAAWRCHADEPNSVIPSKSTPTITNKCHFAGLELNVGDKLKSLHPDISCECQVPPMVHCIQKVEQQK